VSCSLEGMDLAIYRAANAMQAASKRAELVSHNLANSGTTGFKRKLSMEFTAEPGHGRDRQVAHLGQLDFQQGRIERTAHPLHVAIQGGGFLAVDSPRGELYSRNGRLLMSESGELTDDSGYPLVWDQRGAQVDPAGEDLVIEPNGQVLQGNQSLGRLQLVEFADNRALVELSAGYFEADPAEQRLPFTGELLQGHLESSNVNPVAELVELVAAQRTYEMSAQTMRQVDRSYQRLHRPR
jgi:flagellar basal-body rod protein FlgF